MKEFWFQSTKFNNKSSNFTIFCSFILSHPLYFSYLIFFSPYLFKLLSFLSPLFFTTSLLLLSLLTTLIPLSSIINSKEGLITTAYNSLLENLQPDLEDEGGKSTPIEEFEVYKVVFEIPTIEENPVEIEKIEETPVEIEKIQEYPDEFFEAKGSNVGKGTGGKCESLTMEREREKVGANPEKVKEEEGLKKVETKKGSEAIKSTKSGSLRVNDHKKFSETFSQTLGAQPNMGSFGSMRKEKEWRRTLACKLFEERHNGSNNHVSVNGGGGRGGEEGMDSLWETYETELLNKVKTNKVEESTKKGKKGEEKMEDLIMGNEEDDDNYDDNGKFCCLQALKLSAGKMNLSMGMKISKAFKGIGFLQNHVKKHGKKGYK
ncbi:hypothetical protein SOVF_020150 [Spinacia oleracea]|uniref:Uncharacterized protein n=1 Tax=Spinacia oleracea TaxID=3562 RepID=A0A9R0JA01_SPIOL|nr:uncharacterized protein LOC110802810 [Spinacia oleracea]KNA23997.1 hypothetical protein SOVF_020150 [Spinacia oleracea]